MSDDLTPGLSPEEEAEVARLLADAGGPVPAPPEVVARLDDVLAGLVADRAAGDLTVDPGSTSDEDDPDGAGGSTLTPLAVRRRRWPRALLAAAAVVVVGYGVGSTLDGVGSGADMASSGAGGGAAEDRVSAGGSGSESDGGSALRGDLLRATGRPLLRLSSDDFETGVLKAVRVPTAQDDREGSYAEGPGSESRSDTATDSQANVDKNELGARKAARARCAAPPAQGRDRWAVVRYDGKLATLVVGPERDGAVRARVFSCDGTTLLRDTTVDLT